MCRIRSCDGLRMMLDSQDYEQLLESRRTPGKIRPSHWHWNCRSLKTLLHRSCCRPSCPRSWQPKQETLRPRPALVEVFSVQGSIAELNSG